MEKTVVQFSEQKRETVQIQQLYIAGSALMIGSLYHPLAFVFALILSAYFYLRDIKECKIVIAGVLFGSLLCGIFTTYLYALGFTLFFLSIHVLSLLKKNVYRAMPYVCAALTIPYSLYSFGIDVRMIIIAFLTFCIIRSDHHDISWIQKKLVFTSTIYGVLFLSVCLLAEPWLSEGVAELVLSAILFGSAFFCEPLTLIYFGILYALSTPVTALTMFTLIGTACIVWLKKEPWILACALGVYAFWAMVDPAHGALLLIGGITGFLYDEKRLPFHMERHRQKEENGIAQSVLKKQIHNFASIFDSLSEYYEQISDVEAQMLSDMAKALKYSADTLKKVDTNQTQKQRILKALEGYQYDVLSFELDQSEDGSISMELDIRSIKKSEITQTLLPLLEVLTHEHLKISDVSHHRFTNGSHHITLENHVPFKIDAYADSQKNMFDASGDSFSIFRFRNTIISMISDGMGSGEHAAASSRLITNIFQRMVVSGIPKTDSIKCINKLLQSDAYATLDVVCFDCAAGKAYIFKSAACPTFLIRDGHLYEVNGSSLPVGIISSIEPDCFVADMKEGDEYLIISDGIFMDEIYEWLKVRKSETAKASMESLMEILNRKQRLDDSTAVLSKVQKA